MHTHSAVPTAIYIAMGTATRQQSIRVLSSVDAIFIYFSMTHSPCIEVTHRPICSMAIRIAMGIARWQQRKQECFHLLMPPLSTSA